MISDHVWAVPPFIEEQHKEVIEKGKTFIEFEHPVMMMTKLKKKAVFFDIGANNGIIGLSVASIKVQHSVYLFEPVPSMVDHLCASKLFGQSQSDYKSLQIIEAAVSNTHLCDLTLFVPFREDNTAAGSSRTAALNLVNKNVTEIKVKTITLDNYIAFHKIQKVSFLKIDTQGHELHVLKGAENSLKSQMIEMILCENDPKLMASVNNQPQDILTFMTSVGYECYTVHDYDISADQGKFIKNSTAKPYDYLTPIHNTQFVYDVLWFPSKMMNKSNHETDSTASKIYKKQMNRLKKKKNDLI